jgi:hypothetical protein
LIKEDYTWTPLSTWEARLFSTLLVTALAWASYVVLSDHILTQPIADRINDIVKGTAQPSSTTATSSTGAGSSVIDTGDVVNTNSIRTISSDMVISMGHLSDGEIDLVIHSRTRDMLGHGLVQHAVSAWESYHPRHGSVHEYGHPLGRAGMTHTSITSLDYIKYRSASACIISAVACLFLVLGFVRQVIAVNSVYISLLVFGILVTIVYCGFEAFRLRAVYTMQKRLAHEDIIRAAKRYKRNVQAFHLSSRRQVAALGVPVRMNESTSTSTSSSIRSSIGHRPASDTMLSAEISTLHVQLRTDEDNEDDDGNINVDGDVDGDNDALASDAKVDELTWFEGYGYMIFMSFVVIMGMFGACEAVS